MTGLRQRMWLPAFAALIYAPLLATARGHVVADTKSYLYLDPDRLLSRAWSMWDPHVGLGTVTHQNIGFLWPMGPYYWAMEHLGVPDWVAQRLWLGSIMFLAGLGVRYLLRTFDWSGPAVGVAMVAYALTPYLLTIAPRISAILLSYAALPWMVALTVRALRTGSWRHPAAFALVVATVGTSNATSILLIGVGPLLWVVWAVATRQEGPGRVVAAVGRIGGLTLATNAWWIVGLSVQATNGIDVLQYTESVEVTAAASSAQEVLRGLGYWFFYGDDPIGPWIGPSRPYQTSLWLLSVTFAVPVLALAGAAVGRWRERSFFVVLALVGLALAVGVHPYDEPSPFGTALRAFLHSDVGMAMRSMPRAAPLVVLALAVMLGAGLQALGRRLPRASLPAAAFVMALVVLGLPPLWQRDLAPPNLSRPEEVPGYWTAAGAHLDSTDDGTRVLELPGSDFTSYRWGTTIDPVTPGLTDRPIIARELVPMGSAPAWNLVKAYDGRFQARLAEPASVAAVARVMRAGQVLVRSDLEYEHYDTPRPRDLWQLLLGAPGLGEPVPFGTPAPNVARPPVPMLDELELSLDPDLVDPPPVAVIPVEDALPIVTTKPTARPVIVAGDGEGVVDIAAAGLIDGRELLRYSAAMSDEELAAALDDGAVLVVTDTNRRRGERWGTIRFTSGYTEPAGLEPLAVDRSDARLPVFPDAGDDARTVAVHRGGITANATSYGGRNEYLPEDRPSRAVDGDPATAWRTSRDDPVVGERLELRTDAPVTTSTLTFLAPPAPINRWVTRVALRFDGAREPVVVSLDERSHRAPGQQIDIGERTFSRLDIEILADTAGRQGRYGGLTSTGFAEIGIGDLRLDEAVRPPVDLLRRVGDASTTHPLAIVLTRLRSAATDIERLDEEPTLVRLLELPTRRRFELTGTARLSPRATDVLLDTVLTAATGGAPATVATTATSSSRLAGTAARASAALDGDRSTAWTTAYGDQVGQWIDVGMAEPRALDRLDLVLVADGRHSVPTRIAVDADGRRVGSFPLPPVPDGAVPGSTAPVTVRLPQAIDATTLRVTVEEVRPVETTDWGTRRIRTMPVGIAELGVPGLVRPAPSGRFASGCRTDLLTVDGGPIGVEVTGTVADAIAGAPLAIRSCGGAPFELAGAFETHELHSARGAVTGVDIDRLVLRSPADPSTPADAAPAPPSATVLDQDADSLSVRIEGAQLGDPFWLAFGQSWNTGWEATIDGDDLGPPALVDAFANGWLVTPDSASFVVELRFAPQQRVTIALWGSLAAAVLCLALTLMRPTPRVLGELRREDRDEIHQEPDGVALPGPVSVVAGVGMALLGLALVTPAVGMLVGLLTLVSARAVLPRVMTAAVAPLAMAVSAGYVVLTVWRRDTLPGLEWPSELSRAHPIAWLAVLALAADAIVGGLQARRRR